jgi:NAD dependent epimerase/dehydratase
MTQRTLVTGASGFVGSHLVEALVHKGDRVRAFTHYNSQNRWGWLDTLPLDIVNEIEVVSSDIRDPHAVTKAVKGCQTVFHLAALIAIPFSYLAPTSYIETNVIGTANILNACLSENVDHLIHTSTSETYGSAQEIPIDEHHPLVAQSPYAATKIAADKLAESYQLSFGLPVSTIRPFNTYGPRQSLRAVIPSIICQALDKPDRIFLGALNPERDLTFVKDTVQGFLAIAAGTPSIGEVINIGNGKSVSIGKLAHMILSICKSSAEILTDENRLRPMASEVLHLVCNHQKAKDLLCWQPAYSLKRGLEETVGWYEDNRHYYKTEMYAL